MGVKKNLPAKKFRAGAVSVTVWNNSTQSKAGELIEYQTVNLERRYKDRNGVSPLLKGRQRESAFRRLLSFYLPVLQVAHRIPIGIPESQKRHSGGAHQLWA